MRVQFLLALVSCLQPILAAPAAQTSTTTSPTPTPIIKNGDFETGKLAPWKVRHSSGTATGDIAKASIHQPGLNSTFAAELAVAHAAGDASPQSVVGLRQTFTVIPNHSYVFGYAVKRLVGGKGLTYLDIGLSGSVNTISYNGSQPDVYTKKPGQWNQFQSLLVPTESTATFVATLHTNGTKTSVGVLLDQIYIFPIGGPTGS